MESDETSKTTVVAVLGFKNTGKTFFAYRLVFDDNIPKIIPTVGVDEYVNENDDIRVVDASGSCTVTSRQRSCYYRKVTCFTAVYSMTSQESLEYLEEKLLPEIKRENFGNVPVILVGTCQDFNRGVSCIENYDEWILDLKKEFKIYSMFEISNVTGEGIDDFKVLLEDIVVSGSKYLSLKDETKGNSRKKLINILGRSLPDSVNVSNFKLSWSPSDLAPQNELKLALAIKLEFGNELIFYSFHGNIAKVRDFIERGHVPLNSKSNSDVCPLSAALMNKQKEVVRLLLQYFDLNIRIVLDGVETPLRYCIMNGIFEEALMLLRSSQMDIRFSELNLLEGSLVAMQGQTIQDEFRKHRIVEKQFFEAVVRKDVDEVSRFLKLVNVDCRNESELSALEVSAAVNDNEKLVEVLLKNGAYVSKEMIRRYPQYENALQAAYHEQEVLNVLREFVETEKTFLEKLRFALHFYVKNLVKDLTSLVAKKSHQKDVLHFFGCIRAILKESEKLLVKFRGFSLVVGMTDEEKMNFVRCIMEIELESYLKLLESWMFVVKLTTQKNKFAERVKIIKENIPVNRAACSFYSYILSIKDRMFGYNNLLMRLLKRSHSQIFLEVLHEASREVKLVLKKINEKFGNDQKMSKVKKIFRKQFKLKILEKNKKREVSVFSTLNSSHGQYVYHIRVDEKWIVFMDNITDGSFVIPMPSQSSWVFFFSDIIAFVREDDSVDVFFIYDTKFAIVFTERYVDIKVYQFASSTMTYHYQVHLHKDIISRMYTVLKEYYTMKNKAFYLSKVLLINNMFVDREIEDFLKFTQIENQVGSVFEKKELLELKNDRLHEEMDENERDVETFVKMAENLMIESNNLGFPKTAQDVDHKTNSPLHIRIGKKKK